MPMEDLRARPLSSRKAVLKQLLRDRHDMVVMDGIAGEGSRLFQAVCEVNLAGIEVV
jgi:ATP-dependent DNA ligase